MSFKWLQSKIYASSLLLLSVINLSTLSISIESWETRYFNKRPNYFHIDSGSHVNVGPSCDDEGCPEASQHLTRWSVLLESKRPPSWMWSNLKMFLSGDWDWIIFTLSPPFTEGRNESDRSILNSWNVSRQSVSVSPSSNMASRQSCLTSNILLWNISILKYIILFHISWLNSFVWVPYRHSLEGDNYFTECL